MKKIKLEATTELTVKGIVGFIIRRVTPFGNGAKVDCPKEYLGRKVYLVILNE
jgi:putative transposon-encoded protein